MSAPLSVDDIVSRLEAQLAFHEEREAFHAGQEAHHREQRGVHAAEAEKIRQSLGTFREAAAAAAGLAARIAPPPPPPRPAPAPRKRRQTLSLNRMALAVIQQMGRHETFGRSKVAREIERQFGDRLAEPLDIRAVSIALRRLSRNGSIHRLRTGKPHHEAVYARERPPKEQPSTPAPS